MQRKKKIGIGIGVLLLLIFGFGRGGVDSQEDNAIRTKTVSLIEASDFEVVEGYISAIGEVESTEEVTLSAELTGVIEAAYVKIGDLVVEGQKLVEFKADTQNAQLAQASAAIERAQASLNLATAGPSESEEARAASSLAQALGAYNQAVIAAQQSRDRANANLSMAENNLNLVSDTAKQNLSSSIKSSYTLVLNILEDSDSILGIDNEGLNDAFEGALAAYDSSSLREAERTYDSLRRRYELEASSIQMLTVNDELLPYVDQARDLLNVAEDHLYAMVSVMENTPESQGLSAAGIQSYLSQFVGNLSTIQNQILGLEQSAEGLDAEATNNANAQIAYDTSVMDYDQMIVMNDANLESAKKALVAAQAAYDLVMNGPRDVDIAGYKAGVSEAQANYMLTAANYGKTQLVSPLTGKVAAISVKEGDLVGAGTAVVTVVNSKYFQVTTAISPRDFKWVAVGDPVKIADRYDGEVLNVAPSVNPLTRKVEVTILVTSTRNNLVIGDFAEVEIRSQLASADTTSYFLPLAAVKVGSDMNSVFVVKDGIVEAIEVELGDIEGEKIEVLSGLTGSEEIIRSVRGIKVGDSVTIAD